jgi:hypothetical protein
LQHSGVDLDMHISAEAKLEQWDTKKKAGKGGKILEIEKKKQ